MTKKTIIPYMLDIEYKITRKRKDLIDYLGTILWRFLFLQIIFISWQIGLYVLSIIFAIPMIFGTISWKYESKSEPLYHIYKYIKKRRKKSEVYND